MHTFSKDILLNDRINDYIARLDGVPFGYAGIVTDTNNGRHAICRVLEAYNAQCEHGEPIVFTCPGNRRIDNLSLYQRTDSVHNRGTQLHGLGYLLNVAPLDSVHTNLVPGYFRHAHGRIIQRENGDGTLTLSFPLILAEHDVTPMLSILCHLLDTNGANAVRSVEWSARDTSHDACAEYACFTRGIYLKDASGWHTDRIDSAHETLNDY